MLEVGLVEGHKCFVLASHLWHSFTCVLGRSSDTHVLQRQASCLLGNHGGVLTVRLRRRYDRSRISRLIDFWCGLIVLKRRRNSMVALCMCCGSVGLVVCEKVCLLIRVGARRRWRFAGRIGMRLSGC